MIDIVRMAQEEAFVLIDRVKADPSQLRKMGFKTLEEAVAFEERRIARLATAVGRPHDVIDLDLQVPPTFPMSSLCITVRPEAGTRVEVHARSHSDAELKVQDLFYMDGIGPMGVPRRQFTVDPTEPDSVERAAAEITGMGLYPHHADVAATVSVTVQPRSVTDVMLRRHRVPAAWCEELRARVEVLLSEMAQAPQSSTPIMEHSRSAEA